MRGAASSGVATQGVLASTQGIYGFNAVFRDHRVWCDDIKPLGLRLGDQHTVKRIAVQGWQLACLFAMEEGDRKLVESLILNESVEVIRRFKFAERLLDGDFPSACRTDNIDMAGISLAGGLT